MAASAISQEEFQRLQNQLLDLRSANYTLMEESNRYRNGSFLCISDVYHLIQQINELQKREMPLPDLKAWRKNSRKHKEHWREAEKPKMLNCCLLKMMHFKTSLYLRKSSFGNRIKHYFKSWLTYAICY